MFIPRLCSHLVTFPPRLSLFTPRPFRISLRLQQCIHHNLCTSRLVPTFPVYSNVAIKLCSHLIPSTSVHVCRDLAITLCLTSSRSHLCEQQCSHHTLFTPRLCSNVAMTFFPHLVPFTSLPGCSDVAFTLYSHFLFSVNLLVVV